MSLPSIGDMRERITLSVPTMTTDAMGQQVEAFAEPFYVWAMVTETMSGESGNTYDGTENKRTILAVVRNNANRVFTTRMKLQWRGIDFNVAGIRWLDGPKRFVELKAEVML